jgi:hypothetical protein
MTIEFSKYIQDLDLRERCERCEFLHVFSNSRRSTIVLCEDRTCTGCHVNEIIISLEIASLTHEMYKYLKPLKLQYQQ